MKTILLIFIAIVLAHIADKLDAIYKLLEASK
jgi:hypothetical protein